MTHQSDYWTDPILCREVIDFPPVETLPHCGRWDFAAHTVDIKLYSDAAPVLIYLTCKL